MKSKEPFSISGNIVDVINKRIYKGTIHVENGTIKTIKEEDVTEDQYLLPGLVDAHVHIESSMLIPSEFARLAVLHGTVATVSDPHEIANVLGKEGIEFMINNGNKVPFKFYFGASSCVPATPFETSGAVLSADDVDQLLQKNNVKYLAEMMNFPGVLSGDEEVTKKLEAARKYGKVIDGHAPGLKGEDVKKYAEAGISTDHESSTLEEANDKLKAGIKIQIREGSAAKNFEALAPLIQSHPDQIMFCSDDKHPDDLVQRHINDLVRRALKMGYDPLTVLRIATYNPIKHYGLEVGMVQEGDPADFIVTDDLNLMKIKQTYINGKKVAENGKTKICSVDEKPLNTFHARKLEKADLKVPAQSETILVQKAFDGELLTDKLKAKAKIENGQVISDTGRDVLKILVMNRYQPSKPAIGFVNGFGLQKGAIASTVAHDSHNIIAVGTNDDDLVKAVNMLVDKKGGVSLVNNDEKMIIPLPVAGLMSENDGFLVAERYEIIDKKTKELGTKLTSPYMTLSFMALLVIPSLKISDKGLFDGTRFEFVDMFQN